MFHVLYHELKWREQTGRATGKTFGALQAYKPLIALGAQFALEEKLHAKDGFRTIAIPWPCLRDQPY